MESDRQREWEQERAYLEDKLPVAEFRAISAGQLLQAFSGEVNNLRKANFLIYCRQKGILLKEPDSRLKLQRGLELASTKEYASAQEFLAELKELCRNNKGVAGRLPDFEGYQPASSYSVEPGKCNTTYNFYLFGQEEPSSALSTIPLDGGRKGIQIAVVASLLGFTPMHIKHPDHGLQTLLQALPT